MKWSEISVMFVKGAGKIGPSFQIQVLNQTSTEIQKVPIFSKRSMKNPK
jgi:hypothetical protein